VEPTKYSVANRIFWTQKAAYGQVFTPDDGGPDGQGAPSNSSVNLMQIVVGLYDFATQGQVMAYAYSAPLASADEIGTEESLLGSAAGTSGAGSGSGSGALTLTFDFQDQGIQLNTNARYFIYFLPALSLRVRADDCYSGGAIINADYGLTQDPYYMPVIDISMLGEDDEDED